jgi:S1-C subfamily serine protease
LPSIESAHLDAEQQMTTDGMSLRVLRLVAALLSMFAAGVATAQSHDDVADTLAAIVRVDAKISPLARSAATLGVERQGTGILIRDGIVLTIGYLVTEAESISVLANDGRRLQATLAAYDHASGLGILRLKEPLAAKPLPLGDSESVRERTPAMILTYGGRETARVVQVTSRRRFAGNWEYMLDSAIYTAPAVTNWSGAALLSDRGELIGIGSLVVGNPDPASGQPAGNLFVPVETLTPILDDLIADGRRRGEGRPWLGINADELMGHLFVTRVSPGGPADKAGIKAGDIVVRVGEDGVTTLPDFYRQLWKRGGAGIEVPLQVLQGASLERIRVRSIERNDYFRTEQPAR